MHAVVVGRRQSRLVRPGQHQVQARHVVAQLPPGRVQRLDALVAIQPAGRAHQQRVLRQAQRFAAGGAVARMEHRLVHRARHRQHFAARAVAVHHQLAQRFAGGEHQVGAAHRVPQCGHHARDPGLAEALEIVVEIGDEGHAQPPRQRASQNDVRDVRRGNQQVRRECAQAPQQLMRIRQRAQPQRLRMPRQRARLRRVHPVALLAFAVVAQAIAGHVVPEPRQLEGDLVEPRIAVQDHVLAHVAALAEVGDAHRPRPAAQSSSRRAAASAAPTTWSML